ncbi:hypothetical protein RA280_46465 [Cupriavidus sp. CV2]|uniref:hypothetical protein n=1 Tax=Cupriavidus ulmosensis TaxID=3065913 RepID=UPI00296B567C|nr:hypothetical protein [Cupriavidus sp. CV2]MDW3689038.1 hypothetical protein [Cupriavidus sp. CV2]
MTTPRFMVENVGTNIDAVKIVFEEAFKYAVSNGIAQITLLVPVKGAFPDTAVEKFVGPNAKSLCKGGSMQLGGGVSLDLITARDAPSYRSNGIVIGVYLSQIDLDALDSVRSARAIVYLPCFEEEGKAWMSTWSPVVWGASTWSVAPVSLPPAVEAELLRLTSAVNLTTGLSHPSDKENAKRTFSSLKRDGHNVQPEDLRRWAIKNGWAPRHAEDLFKLAGKYFG